MVTVCDWPEVLAVAVPSIVVRARRREHFPIRELGFAWGSLLRGIPPMFFKEWASGLDCWDCGGAENKCVEAVGNAGDAGWGGSNWSAYFIEEYNAKIT